MNQKEYMLLASVINKTRELASLEDDAIIRQAQNEALSLLAVVLTSALKAEYKTFHEDKFLKAIGR